MIERLDYEENDWTEGRELLRLPIGKVYAGDWWDTGLGWPGAEIVDLTRLPDGGVEVWTAEDDELGVPDFTIGPGEIVTVWREVSR